MDKQLAFYRAAFELASQPVGTYGQADAAYVLENLVNPVRHWPEGSWLWVDVEAALAELATCHG
jgi:hypothetical protein